MYTYIAKAYNFSHFVNYLPNFIKIDGSLTKFWQKQFCTDFSETRCRPTCTFLLARRRGGPGGGGVIDAAFGAHGKSRPRFKPGTLLHRWSDLGQVVNLSL